LAAVSAYVISEVRIVDTQAAERYVALAEASITRYGGRYVARAAVPEVPEGDWDEGWRVVIVEFPTMAKLKEWHTSDDYAEALSISSTALERRLLLVPGIDD
jgi:uncharacterized protein (DUF1330 family)